MVFSKLGEMGNDIYFFYFFFSEALFAKKHTSLFISPDFKGLQTLLTLMGPYFSKGRGLQGCCRFSG